MNESKTGPMLLASVALLLSVAACSLVLLLVPGRATPAAPPPSPDSGSTQDPTEIAEMRHRLQEVETRLAELEDREAAGDPPEGEELDVHALLTMALEEGSPALDELVAAAAARARQGADGGNEMDSGKGKGWGDGKGAALIAWIDSEVERWAETHSLAPTQVEALNLLTRRVIQQRTEAKESGASDWELTRLDVVAQAEVRQIVGDQVYVATERDRLTRELRGWVTWLPSSVGGLSDEQHAQLDQIIASSVEGRLYDTVRLRSEPMAEEDHGALGQELGEQQKQTWSSIREEVLTEVQRARIPGK